MCADKSALFAFEGFNAEALSHEDGASLQVLLEKSADYIELATGSPPGPGAAESLLLSRPETCDLESKVVIGLFDKSGEMGGVIDSVRGYPSEGDWWLGLLLLAPSLRGRGLGDKAYQEFSQWAARQGAKQIYLGVLLHNKRASRFWLKLGFEEVERRPARDAEHSGATVILMRRAVDASLQRSPCRPTTR